MLTNLSKAKFEFDGVRGLPEDYPVPPHDNDTLFYIQRNLNQNTVVYECNRNAEGGINKSYPMHPYWIKYSHGGNKMELNFIQNKLAYGYTSNWISNELYEFRMVSYEHIQFYMAYIEEEGGFKAITKINGEKSLLSNIYVFAEELGLFPDVKYFELYGTSLESGLSVYQKIVV